MYTLFISKKHSSPNDMVSMERVFVQAKKDSKTNNTRFSMVS